MTLEIIVLAERFDTILAITTTPPPFLRNKPPIPYDPDFHRTSDQAVLAGGHRRAEPLAAHVLYVVIQT